MTGNELAERAARCGDQEIQVSVTKHAVELLAKDRFILTTLGYFHEPAGEVRSTSGKRLFWRFK